MHADSESMIVDVGGVGYLVRATTGMLRAAQQSPEQVVVHVHTSVREDAIQLYGFQSTVEKTVFERLVSLQGVGPKVAIGVLSSLSPVDLQRATLHEDVALLQSVPGVGPKVARRIVTELRDKLDDITPGGVTTFHAELHDSEPAGADVASFYEAREALVGLGMSINEAEQALSGSDSSASAADRVKHALSTRSRPVRP